MDDFGPMGSNKLVGSKYRAHFPTMTLHPAALCEGKSRGHRALYPNEGKFRGPYNRADVTFGPGIGKITWDNVTSSVGGTVSPRALNADSA
jgi:hypothetical protein